MAAPTIGSLLIGSSGVDRMKQWYRDAFRRRRKTTWARDFGTVGVFIETHS